MAEKTQRKRKASRPSSITQLDPSVKDAVDTAIREGRLTIDQIVELIARSGGEASRSAVGRYVKNATEKMEDYGQSRILMIQATLPWYLENLPPYKGAFEDQLIELPMDADVLSDHRVPRVVKGVPQIPELRQVDAAKKKRHGDTFIAGALAWHASRNLFGTAEYGYEPAPPRMSRWDSVGDEDHQDARFSSGGRQGRQQGFRFHDQPHGTHHLQSGAGRHAHQW